MRTRIAIQKWWQNAQAYDTSFLYSFHNLFEKIRDLIALFRPSPIKSATQDVTCCSPAIICVRRHASWTAAFDLQHLSFDDSFSLNLEWFTSLNHRIYLSNRHSCVVVHVVMRIYSCHAHQYTNQITIWYSCLNSGSIYIATTWLTMVIGPFKFFKRRARLISQGLHHNDLLLWMYSMMHQYASYGIVVVIIVELRVSSTKSSFWEHFLSYLMDGKYNYL